MSRDELVVVVAQQAGQIRAQAETIAKLMEANEALADKLARLEHLHPQYEGSHRRCGRWSAWSSVRVGPAADDELGVPAQQRSG
jgi:iron-sulfur cluster repair protein YtfE (RIC family)